MGTSPRYGHGLVCAACLCLLGLHALLAALWEDAHHAAVVLQALGHGARFFDALRHVPLPALCEFPRTHLEQFVHAEVTGCHVLC